MQAALAALPILVVVLAMAVLHWRAALAGAAGLCVALAVVLGPGGSSGGGVLVAGVVAEAASSTLAILWIILPALVIYEVQQRSGACDRMRLALSRLSDDRAVQALLIAWFFGPFMEGAAGFGAPVALAAPLLAGLGFTPVRAVALALLGHAAGVSLGAVGTPRAGADRPDGPARAAVGPADHDGACAAAVPAVGLGDASGNRCAAGAQAYRDCPVRGALFPDPRPAAGLACRAGTAHAGRCADRRGGLCRGDAVATAPANG